MVTSMQKIVHIIPLGYEIDRAVKTFDEYPANRVYILYSPSKGSSKAEYFRDQVTDKLKKKGIEVIQDAYDIFDIQKAMSKISSIIVKEKKADNLVYVNMSAASMLSAVAATFAAMYQDVQVYYVKADSKETMHDIMQRGKSAVDNLNITKLSNFNIDIPSGAKLELLVELYSKGNMKTRDIEAMITDKKLEGFEDLIKDIKNKTNEQKVLMRINKSLLNELKIKNYIKVEKKGRSNNITISEKGKYAACLSGNIK